MEVTVQLYTYTRMKILVLALSKTLCDDGDQSIDVRQHWVGI
jgi:hypothetical protein